MTDVVSQELRAAAARVSETDDAEEMRAAIRTVTRAIDNDEVDGRLHVVLTTCRNCIRYEMAEAVPELLRVCAEHRSGTVSEARLRDAHETVQERIREEREDTDRLAGLSSAYDEAVESVLDDLRERKK